MLEYCSPVWSPHTICQINSIETVQRFFTKRIAGLWSVPSIYKWTLCLFVCVQYKCRLYIWPLPDGFERPWVQNNLCAIGQVIGKFSERCVVC